MSEAKDIKQSVELLASALQTLQTHEEAQALLLDLLTPREIIELARRVEVARLLDGGTSYVGIASRTGASSTTVSRVSKCLNGNTGGYRLVLDRLRIDEPT